MRKVRLWLYSANMRKVRLWLYSANMRKVRLWLFNAYEGKYLGPSGLLHNSGLDYEVYRMNRVNTLRTIQGTSAYSAM